MLDEAEEWDRLLTFLKQANVFSKSRLAEIVASIEDEDELAKAEKFNDEFISEDEIIVYLEGELKKQRRNLERSKHHDEDMLRQLTRNQKKLRMDIRRAEEIIIITKRDFSDYITELV
jgi:small-conductance mechanosensitive channel